MRYGRWLIVVSVVAMVAVTEAAALAAAELAPQTRSDGGVKVTVAPRSISPAADPWEFEVTLETHSVTLDQDLTRASVLVDAQGNRHAPIGWEGDPPGGHHRKGVLRFKALPELPPAIELRIGGVGSVDRVFRWQLQ